LARHASTKTFVNRIVEIFVPMAGDLYANCCTILIPLHQQPIAWAMQGMVKSVDFRADNKPRHWLTRMGN
jgi:hypothetical protein